MEANAFVAEVYRRMAMRAAARNTIAPAIPPTAQRVADTAAEYRTALPSDKKSAILDIGYGDGWFMAACRRLGYENVSGADFGVSPKPYMNEWGVKLFRIETNIGDFLKNHREEFDFIHMSHVIEHIPKYSLFWVMDALYQALKNNGVLYLRTPNMEGPTPNSSYYVTLAHEYGFAGSNLASLLDICGFEDVRFIPAVAPGTSLKRFAGKAARWPYVKLSKIRHRLFGVNQGGQFHTELIATGRRGEFPPYFDEKYR